MGSVRAGDGQVGAEGEDLAGASRDRMVAGLAVSLVSMGRGSSIAILQVVNLRPFDSEIMICLVREM